MNTAPFVAAAYAITGLLLFGLILASYLRARRAGRALRRADP
jgi:heme exporter protein CcmD